MATAKTPAKKAPAKKVVAKAIKRPVETQIQQERTYGMPHEVKEWIDRASSTM
jgi:hypothetical protein